MHVARDAVAGELATVRCPVGLQDLPREIGLADAVSDAVVDARRCRRRSRPLGAPRPCAIATRRCRSSLLASAGSDGSSRSPSATKLQRIGHRRASHGHGANGPDNGPERFDLAPDDLGLATGTGVAKSLHLRTFSHRFVTGRYATTTGLRCLSRRRSRVRVPSLPSVMSQDIGDRCRETNA